VLRTERPDDGVVGEESGTTGPVSDRTWLVHPLCGTLNFAATTPLVAVNVALRSGPSLAVAAVADPIADEAWWTDGSGVRTADGRAVGPSAVTQLVDVNLDGFRLAPGRLDPGHLVASEDFRARFGPRVLPTALALTWVAIGRRAAYLTDGAVHDSVHFAAGIALCRAAGCVVTDLRGGEVGGDTGLVAAADAETHAALLDLVVAATRR
jgi:myo-inositol-1(or 4)-monophosphatase